jgi:redox-sensitive bicupin YhaK (pirin superfamily)
MSAGSGVTHSEFNPSRDERVHFLQIWILPDQSGGEPCYAEQALPTATTPDALSLVFAGKPRGKAIAIRADADVFLGRLTAGRTLVHPTSPSRGLYLQIIRGRIVVGGASFAAGDGAAIEDCAQLEIASEADAEFLLFDLR